MFEFSASTQDFDEYRQKTSINEIEMNDYAKQGATANFNKLHDEWRKSLDGWKKIEKKGDLIIKADKLVKKLQQPSVNG